MRVLRINVNSEETPMRADLESCKRDYSADIEEVRSFEIAKYGRKEASSCAFFSLLLITVWSDRRGELGPHSS